MMSPETSLYLAQWRLFGQSILSFARDLADNSRLATPERLKALSRAVDSFTETGVAVLRRVDGEARAEAKLPPGTVPEVQPEPRMIHDLPGIYMPEANRGWLKDMVRPAKAPKRRRFGRFTLIDGGRA